MATPDLGAMLARWVDTLDEARRQEAQAMQSCVNAGPYTRKVELAMQMIAQLDHVSRAGQTLNRGAR